MSANLGEGYSRSTPTHRLRFLGYALGAARECVTWYEAIRGVLADDVIDQRLALVTRMRSLLLGLIRSLRGERKAASQLERKVAQSCTALA